MQVCENCGQQISYARLIFAPRHVKCSKCNAKFKVNIQNYYVYSVMVICGSVAFYFTLTTLNSFLKVVAIIAIFFSIFLLAPFNQRLVSTANKPPKKDK
jgi:CXXC-20-CXXC protein